MERRIRRSAAEHIEITRVVEQSPLLVGRGLDQLTVQRSSFDDLRSMVRPDWKTHQSANFGYSSAPAASRQHHRSSNRPNLSRQSPWV